MLISTKPEFLYGYKDFATGKYLRWHIKRNIVNPSCPLCG